MSIRLKTMFLIGLVLTASTMLLHSLISIQQLASYRSIERASAERDVNRVKAVLLKDLNDYGFLTSDYGSWTQTYQFVEDHNAAYTEENFGLWAVIDLKLNFMVVVDLQGEVVFSRGADLKREKEIDIPVDLIDQLKVEGAFLSEQTAESDIEGFLLVDDKVLLTSVAPILRTDDSGPRRGFFVMARYLDRAKRLDLEKQTQLELSLVGRKSSGFPERLQPVLERLAVQEETEKFSTEKPLTELEYVNDETIKGHILFSDPAGEPILLATASIPRTIYQAGMASLDILLVALTGAGLLLVVVVLLLLDWMVLRRLVRLGKEVSAIGETTDLNARVNASGTDEFSQVGTAINWMLEQLNISGRKLEEEHARAEDLLLNILPEPIAERLKTGSKPIADSYDEVSILFADIVGFTKLAKDMPADRVVELLNALFSGFDDLAIDLGIEKIKTIGDAYMVASGLPEPNRDHATMVANMALGMLDLIKDCNRQEEQNLSLRIGINSGIVVAGVIGKNKFIYDLWGDAVNLASRMESSGEAGRIQVSQSTFDKLADKFEFEKRGEVDVKGRGRMTTYFLKGRLNPH